MRAIKIVRVTTPDHLEMVAPLFDAYRVFYEQPSNLKQAHKYLEARLENEESVIFLAVTEINGRATAAGFTQLYPSFSSLSMAPTWILYDLYVAPDFRQQGVGKDLMARARRLATETGAKEVTLATASDNYAAQSLYESLGYKRDKEFIHYWLEI